jgi:hypothetical protein
VRRTLVSPLVRASSSPLQRSTNHDAGQVGKQLGDKWKNLTEKQKAPYEAKAAQDKKRYEEEKAKYNVSLTRP